MDNLENWAFMRIARFEVKSREGPRVFRLLLGRIEGR